MNLHDLLFGSGKMTTQVKCSGFGCPNFLIVDLTKSLPEFPVCRQCERRINEGIIASVHAHTSKLSGSYNIFDERLGKL